MIEKDYGENVFSTHHFYDHVTFREEYDPFDIKFFSDR